MMHKVMVVDEEAVLVETIAYNLEQAGYQVVTAADGASAPLRMKTSILEMASSKT
jgi:DNA-binding response OmpR family regulator